MSTSSAPQQPSRSISVGAERPLLSFFTHSAAHPVKPPQPGVEPKVIGGASQMGSVVRVYGREVAVANAVRLNAHRNAQGDVVSKLNVGLRTPESPAPGLYFRGAGAEAGSEAGKPYWNPEVAGPLFVAVGKYGPYVTNLAQDANVVPGHRVALLSVPGELDFVRPADPTKPSMEILLQAHEPLRNQPGSYLSKALVAYPVDEAGKPTPAHLTALRTFWTKAQPAGTDGTPERKSLPFQTPKYEFAITDAGGVTVTQIDGQKSVKEGQKLARQQPTA